jgi:hypothetical protein
MKPIQIRFPESAANATVQKTDEQIVNRDRFSAKRTERRRPAILAQGTWWFGEGGADWRRYTLFIAMAQ